MVRTQLPLLVRAFAEFHRGAPDAFLYLHTDPRDPEGWDLCDLLHRYDLDSCAALPAEPPISRGVDDGYLSSIYLGSDVFALPTMGEGFGLPLLDAMACGVPVIATDCSAVTELVKDVALLIRPAAIVTGSYNVDQALPDVDHLVEHLFSVDADSRLRERMSAASVIRAGRMSWERAAQALAEAVG
jgi:glycosyltransferase involved in cell wall biosynthesis